MKQTALYIGASILSFSAIGGVAAQDQQGATAQQYRELDDLPVLTSDGTPVGEVDNVVIDENGELAYVVEVEEGVTGMDDREVIIPQGRLSFKRQNNRFTTDLTPTDLQDLPTWHD
jgi:sporulation protein YlmC with PRC-barrel domain